MLVVVGGHSRNIGKTSVVAGLIGAIPEARWTAVKITQHGHGICSAAGEPCDCAIDYSHPYALTEQTEPDSTDSGRFLAAGAARSWWLRTRVGELGHGMAALRRILEPARNAMLESNSVLRFLQPDLYLAVLDPAVPDFKDSARLYLDRADALVVARGAVAGAAWAGVPARWLESKPHFVVSPPEFMSADLIGYVRQAIQV